MSDKRTIYEVSTPISEHDDKKMHSKPGRKPLESVPKSKRAAQNRAAQRAYRERKERKMLDLEDKVKALEDETVRANTESDLLKAQVKMLKNELIRYRGNSDFSDLNLPNKVGHLSHPQSNLGAAKSETPASTDSSPDDQKDFSVDFPWSKDNLKNLRDSLNTSVSSGTGQSNYQLPDLVSGSSSSTSPLNENILVSPDSNNSNSNPSTVNSHEFDFAAGFEEQVDPFCVQLNEACGTKQCPVPKYQRTKSVSEAENAALAQFPAQQYSSPFTTLIDNRNNEELSDPFFNNTNPTNYDFTLSGDNLDPLSFLNDTNFDVSLAFADNVNPSGYPATEVKKEHDPIASLTTEESAYDPLNYVNTNFNFNEFVKSSVPSESSNSRSNSFNDVKSSVSSVSSYNNYSPQISKNTGKPVIIREEDDDENIIVPAAEKTVRCSEIWDRITSHPKYTEIDIDGLCNELKSKAKCSERGVVLNSADVNQLLEQSAILKR